VAAERVRLDGRIRSCEGNNTFGGCAAADGRRAISFCLAGDINGDGAIGT